MQAMLPPVSRPYSDIMVVDLTHHQAGPFCTRMLAGMGADVIKVERPWGGDPARRLGPFHRDDAHPEKSGLFGYLNADKRGVTLNLKSSMGVDILKSMVSGADVVVENFRPGVMERLGIEYDTLKEISPGLVMTSVSNFGRKGPYRDYRSSELVSFGMGGPLRVTGHPDRSPVKMGGRIVLYQTGAVAALLTSVALAGLGGRDAGRHVDVSIMETQAGSIDRRMPMLGAYAYTGETSRRQPPSYTFGVGIYPTADGYVNMLNPSYGGRRQGILDMIGRPELKADPRFNDPDKRYRDENMLLLQQYVLEWVLSRPTSEVVAAANANKLLSGPINTPADSVENPHTRARSVWVDVEHPVTGPVRQPGRPGIMSGTPWQVSRPAPTLGQHNREVYCGALGFSTKELQRLRQTGVI